MAKCSLDPEHCIDAVVLGIGSFLKDGVTMACLAGLLIILLRVRNRQKRERDEAYAKQLLEREEARTHSPTGTTWGKPGEEDGGHR